MRKSKGRNKQGNSGFATFRATGKNTLILEDVDPILAVALARPDINPRNGKVQEAIKDNPEDVDNDSSDSESASIFVSLGEEDTNERTLGARQKDSKRISFSIGGIAESSAMGEAPKNLQTQKKPSYASHFANNRFPSHGSKLKQFDKVEGPVVIEADDVEDTWSMWKDTLVGYFGGRFPGKMAFRKIVEAWKVKVKIHHHNSGWIIFQFGNSADQMNVLENGPYIMYGRPLILKIMPRYFEFKYEEISCFPVWIQLRNLSLEMWNPRVLGKICSQIGNSIYMDKLTVHKERVSYARCLIEINMAHELPNSVMLQLANGDALEHAIFYENLPRFCPHYKVLGHSLAGCIVKNKGAAKDQGTEKGKRTIATDKAQQPELKDNSEADFQLVKNGAKTKDGAKPTPSSPQNGNKFKVLDGILDTEVNQSQASSSEARPMQMSNSECAPESLMKQNNQIGSVVVTQQVQQNASDVLGPKIRQSSQVQAESRQDKSKVGDNQGGKKTTANIAITSQVRPRTSINPSSLPLAKGEVITCVKNKKDRKIASKAGSAIPLSYSFTDMEVGSPSQYI